MASANDSLELDNVAAASAKADWHAPDVRSLEAPHIESGDQPSLNEGEDTPYGFYSGSYS